MGRSDKNRKIYNGMMKTYFYTYDKRMKEGAKPHEFRKKPAAGVVSKETRTESRFSDERKRNGAKK